MDMFLAIGITGMFLILWAFLMVQMHRWTQDDILYDIMNGIGGWMLVASAIASHAWPFVVLNFIWGCYAIRDVLFRDKWAWPKNRRIVRRA